MLFNVPIECLEERYSKQWNSWFPRQFNIREVKWTSIYPHSLKSVIEHGSFLDVVNTNYFKAGQLQLITRKINDGDVKDGDIFFFHDLWYPGLEMLAYIRDGLGIDFKIYGILHAGTWDHEDFLYRSGMEAWAKHIEEGWFQFVDGVFVATMFHRDLLSQSRKIEFSKIHVTGLPIYPEFVESVKKENIVVFPHRLDPEKHPEIFEKLALELQQRNRTWGFFYSKEYCRTKQEYYDLLNKSKIAISFADQETWGIAMQEALFCGCIPLVPDKLSYQELYPEAFRFGNFTDCCLEVESIIREPDYFKVYEDLAIETANELIVEGSKAIDNMLKVMKLI